MQMIKLIRILSVIFSVLVIIGDKDIITIKFILNKLIAILYLIILAKKSKIWR